MTDITSTILVDDLYGLAACFISDGRLRGTLPKRDHKLEWVLNYEVATLQTLLRIKRCTIRYAVWRLSLSFTSRTLILLDGYSKATGTRQTRMLNSSIIHNLHCLIATENNVFELSKSRRFKRLLHWDLWIIS